MPYIMTCECGQQMTVEDGQVGGVGRCVNCGQSLHITKDGLVPSFITPGKLGRQVLIACAICFGLIFVLVLASTFRTASKKMTKPTSVTPTQQRTVQSIGTNTTVSEKYRVIPRKTAGALGKPNPFEVTDSLLTESRSAGGNTFQYAWSGSVENRTDQPIVVQVGLLLRDSSNDSEIPLMTGQKEINPHTNVQFSKKLETVRTVKEYDVRVNWATVGPDGQPQTWWYNTSQLANWWSAPQADYAKYSLLRRYHPNNDPDAFGADILVEQLPPEEKLVRLIQHLSEGYDLVLINVHTSQAAYKREQRGIYRPEDDETFILWYGKNKTGRSYAALPSGCNEIRWMQRVGKYAHNFGKKTAF